MSLFIRIENRFGNTFYKLICDGDVYSNGIKSCEKDGIIKFTYLSNNK